MSCDIFLSYARSDDEPFVKRLYEDLTGNGYTVWWDRVAMPCRALTFLQEIQEVGDMIGKKGPVTPKPFTYLRYNAELTREGLNALGLSDIEPEDVQKLDSTDHIKELQRVGRAVVEKKVRPEHFDGFA